MTTGFGSCNNCGAPRMAAEQTQCGACGAPFAASPWGAPQPPEPAAPAWSQQAQAWSQPPDQQAQPPAQQPWSQPPAPPAQQQQPPQTWAQPAPPAPQQPPQTWAQPAPPAPQQPPQTWAQPAPPPAAQPGGYPSPDQQNWAGGYPQGGPGYQQNYPGYPMYAPARSSNTGLIVGVLAVVGIALVIVIAAMLVLASGSKNASNSTLAPLTVPTATARPMGTIVYSPSTIPCGSDYTLTITLPATVSATDVVTVKLDGVVSGTETVSPDFTKQADGTWWYFESVTDTWDCGASGSSSPGRHTEGIYDDLGNLLAYGPYTLV